LDWGAPISTTPYALNVRGRKEKKLTSSSGSSILLVGNREHEFISSTDRKREGLPPFTTWKRRLASAFIDNLENASSKESLVKRRKKNF